MIEIDVLAHMRGQAHTVTSLASVLPASEPKVKALLDRLAADGLASVGGGGYPGGGSSFVASWTATSAESLYGRLLDRYPVPLVGLLHMSVLERFIAALADGSPMPLRRRLVAELENLPVHDPESRRRADALTLAACAVGFAQRALDSDAHAKTAAGDALRSLPLRGAEDLGYAATRLRAYAEQLAEPQFVPVVEHAAAACDAAWELQPLGPRDPATGISGERHIDPSAYASVAEHAAEAMKALAAATPVDVAFEAHAIVERMRPPGIQPPPG
jgi:hypothetical protein